MSDKFVTMLSAGKDSLACYLKLVEQHGKDNVIPVSLSYYYKGNSARDSAIKTHLTNLTRNIGVKLVEGNGKDFSDILDSLFVELNASDYYLSTGEIDHYGEIALYYEIINKYKLKGLYNPFIGKPKPVIFNVLENYNCEFVTISAFLNKNNSSLYDRIFDYIGKRYTARDLEKLYLEDAEVYFALQTVTLKCDLLCETNELDITNLVDVINQEKTMEKSIYLM